MFKVTQKGNFKYLEKFLNRPINSEVLSMLHQYGREGVIALSSATPKQTGTTANSWGYEIRQNRNGIELSWTNSHTNQGARIAILLQYGHSTGTGGYVYGRDYINPAIRPVFDRISENIRKEVSRK